MTFDTAAEFDRQVGMLRETGWPAAAGMPAADLAALLEPLRPDVLRAVADAPAPTPARVPFVLVLTAKVVPPARTVPLTALRGKPGAVSRHLPDLDRFVPLPTLEVPAAEAYASLDVERGEEFCGWVPDTALAEIDRRDRTPLTVEEGIALVAQFPGSLQKNKCFSLGGSRCGDRRVPALWISGGAPMLGWCWAGNPHSWLGVASCGARTG